MGTKRKESVVHRSFIAGALAQEYGQTQREEIVLMNQGPIDAIVGRELHTLWHGIPGIITSALETGMYVATWSIVAFLFYAVVIHPGVAAMQLHWRDLKAADAVKKNGHAS